MFTPLVHDLWADYIRQCSAFSLQHLEDYYYRYFQNQIVQWTGIPQSVSHNQVSFLPNPPDPDAANPNIIIHLNPDILRGYSYNFQIGTECSVRVQLKTTRSFSQL